MIRLAVVLPALSGFAQREEARRKDIMTWKTKSETNLDLLVRDPTLLLLGMLMSCTRGASSDRFWPVA